MAAYRQYVRRVSSLSDLQVAPFRLLASAGAVLTQQHHLWHLEQWVKLGQQLPHLVKPTQMQVRCPGNAAQEQAAKAWWLALTAAGGEGMVLKPLGFTERAVGGLVQPALKVRGREYLRLIYGPTYTQERHLIRLRGHSLKAKRAKALQVALGVEGLTRLAGGQAPARSRVRHERAGAGE